MMLIKTSKPTDKLRVLEDKGYILYMVQFSIEAHVDRHFNVQLSLLIFWNDSINTYHIFNYFQLEKLNNLLVDSLIEITPVIKNWESYIELLQQGIHTVEPSEDDHAELIIIDFMLHCIKQVATGRSPRVKNIDDCNMSLKKSDVNYIILIILEFTFFNIFYYNLFLGSTQNDFDFHTKFIGLIG